MRRGSMRRAASAEAAPTAPRRRAGAAPSRLPTRQTWG